MIRVFLFLFAWVLLYLSILAAQLGVAFLVIYGLLKLFNVT